jgi:hypothetical protein
MSDDNHGLIVVDNDQTLGKRRPATHEHDVTAREIARPVESAEDFASPHPSRCAPASHSFAWPLSPMSPASTTTATATTTPHALRRRLGFALFARAGTEQDSNSGHMVHAREDSGSPTTEHYSESEGTEEEDEVENDEEIDEGEDNIAEMADPLSIVDEDEDDGAKTPRAQDHTPRSPSFDSLASVSSSKRTRPSVHVPPSSSSMHTLSDEERQSQVGDIDDADEDPELNLTKRAWYSFDISVVLALISPIGNWLTGGDYVKNVLLLLFLLYYLHQIIESKHTGLLSFMLSLTLH